jgi:hypothetical protein
VFCFCQENSVSATHLANARGQKVDNALMGHSHHALAVDLDDAVANPHAAPFRDAAPQQRADDAVLHGEAELVLDVGPFDEHLDHWRTRHDRELDRRLRPAACANNNNINNTNNNTNNNNINNNKTRS